MNVFVFMGKKILIEKSIVCIMRLSILYSGTNHLHFFNHLVNVCDACDYCTHCRPLSLNISQHIYSLTPTIESLPTIIEDPTPYIPAIPPSDLLLVFGLHPDLLVGLPDTLSHSSVKAVIIPVDSPDWVQSGLRRQLQDMFEEKSIECSFPKPYCSLEPKDSHPFINKFLRLARLGKPRIEVDIEQGMIRKARCITSAPCGSTWFICEQIRNTRLEDVRERVASAHHSFPCNASMVQDKELGDTILHEAGYIIRNAVREAIEATGNSCLWEEH